MIVASCFDTCCCVCPPLLLELRLSSLHTGNDLEGVCVCRAIVFNSQIEAALAANAAAIMTWQVLPMLVDPEQTYDFTWDSDAGQVIQALTTYAACLVCLPPALVPCSPPPPPLLPLPNHSTMVMYVGLPMGGHIYPPHASEHSQECMAACACTLLACL